MMRRLVLAVAVATTGCFAAVTWEDFTKGNDIAIAGDSGADSGARDDASTSGAIPQPEGGTDAATDAGAAVDAGACAPGTRLFGVKAYDATPAAAGGGDNIVCNPNAALAEDDQWAGLDRNEKETNLDGHDVTGCIGVDLASPTVLAQIQVKSQIHPDACGKTPCGGGQCGSGHSLALFVGANRNALHFVKTFDDIDTKTTNTAQDLGDDPIGTIVVCHEPWSSQRDDMIVDYIAGVCP